MPLSNEPGTDSADALVHDCARHIVDAFGFYNAEFRVITRRAPVRFETRDWKGSQRDAVERIELYDRFVNQTIAEVRLRLNESALDRALWARIRDEFAAQIEGVADNEFTKTFFSSITRQLFGTVGIAPEIEFVATDLDPLAGAQRITRESSGSAAGAGATGIRATSASSAQGSTTRTYLNRGSLTLLIEGLREQRVEGGRDENVEMADARELTQNGRHGGCELLQ